MSAADGGTFKPQQIEQIDWSGRVTLTDAARDVLAERERQINKEGWTAEHDDAHDAGELARGAACYAFSAAGLRAEYVREYWPFRWSKTWFKPTTPRRDLVKAAALVLAEIERLDRMAHNVEG